MYGCMYVCMYMTKKMWIVCMYVYILLEQEIFFATSCLLTEFLSNLNRDSFRLLLQFATGICLVYIYIYIYIY
jgi:hypothetical protein